MSLMRKYKKAKPYIKNGISYVLGSPKVFGPPTNVHIELTNICNLRCIYCPQSVPSEHFTILGKGKMEFETFKSILDKLASHFTVQNLALTRDGEPFLHPDLEHCISYAKSKEIAVNLSSNGTMITLERAESVIRSGLDEMKGDFCFDRGLYEDMIAKNIVSGYVDIVARGLMSEMRDIFRITFNRV